MSEFHRINASEINTIIFDFTIVQFYNIVYPVGPTMSDTCETVVPAAAPKYSTLKQLRVLRDFFENFNIYTLHLCSWFDINMIYPSKYSSS